MCFNCKIGLDVELDLLISISSIFRSPGEHMRTFIFKTKGIGLGLPLDRPFSESTGVTYEEILCFKVLI